MGSRDKLMVKVSWKIPEKARKHEYMYAKQLLKKTVFNLSVLYPEIHPDRCLQQQRSSAQS